MDFGVPALPEEELDPTLNTEVEEVPEEEPSAEREEQSEDPLAKRLKALEQRIGTEDDVRTVKSQRDQLRNELEQLKPLIETLSAQVANVSTQRVQDEDAKFEYAWQQYRASKATPQERAIADQEYTIAKGRRDLDRERMALQNERQRVGQTAEQREREDTARAVFAFFDEQARIAGVDPATLDRTSPQTLKESFQREFQKAQQLRTNPPRQPGHAPQRQGAPAPAKTIDQWFGDAIAKNDYRKINQAMDYLTNNQGRSWEDIVRR